LGKPLKWSHSIQAEKHSAEEPRFDYRIIYNTRISLAKRMQFLKLSPSIAYSLFYNIGGVPIAHYDDAGNLTERSTPDGLHRYRLQLNLNSKINKILNVSVYYMLQNEFNLGSDETKYMNVKNPNTGRTSRRFDNFQVIGTSLNVNLSFTNTNKKSTT
jgi:hypothetical protein